MSDAGGRSPVSEPFPLVVVAGATASGKSHLALRMAERYDGEIVSCDSMQVYRGFDVGTAKVPPALRSAIPHHLIDVREPHETFSAGDFAREAEAALRGIAARRRLPIVAGGTGFYLRALLDGLPGAPARNDALRHRLSEASTPALHRFLRRLDPAAAARIHANDRHKLIRAIEIGRESAASLTAIHRTPRRPLAGFRALRILLQPQRAALYDRINERAAGLFAAGLIDETIGLRARGVDPDTQPFQAVGYREAFAVATGRMSLDEAIAATRQATRHYAKRQETWFRREPWDLVVPGFGDAPESVALVFGFLDPVLAAPLGQSPEIRGEWP